MSPWAVTDSGSTCPEHITRLCLPSPDTLAGKLIKDNHRIGLVCSIDLECPRLMESIRHRRLSRKWHVSVVSGRLGGLPVVVAVGGMGKANASMASVLLVERYGVSLLVNFGIGGACPGSGLSVGDVAVAEKEVYADEGVATGVGIRGVREIGIPLLESGSRRYFNEFPADRGVLKRISKAARKGGIPVHTGTFLTVSSVSGTARRAAGLARKFGGICENMEGAAVFHTARAAGIPCCEIRGISNMAGMRNRERWNIPAAVAACESLLLSFLAGEAGR